MKKIIIASITILVFTSCASIMLPRYQKVSFNTNNKESKVYVNKEKVGEGKQFQERLKKSGTQQVIVKTPNYKDSYYCIPNIKRPLAFYPLRTLSALTLYGLYFDGWTDNTYMYPDMIECKPIAKITKREENQKYINLDAISVDIKDVNSDVIFGIDMTYDEYFQNKYKDLEAKSINRINEAKARETERKKKKDVETLDDQEEEIKQLKFDDTKFSIDIKDALAESGFNDTINEIFLDNNNTLHIEGVITHIYTYDIGRMFQYGWEGFHKVKVTLKWYMKNHYGEVIDSLVHDAFSGDYLYSRNNRSFEDMVSDAIETSYLQLFDNSKFIGYLNYEKELKNPEKQVTLNVKGGKYVSKLSEASDATVIIKREDGHGSGFIVSPDGYIVTNYHVIASEYQDNFDSLTIILASGEKYEAKIITYNRNRDLALLKIDAKFKYIFKLPDAKGFEKMQDVYAIGAPKSIELGQSVSTGIISSERNINNNNLIQLNMSVNGGNSGGPLIDKSANLHGVIVSKLYGFAVEGICFAIPAYEIKNYLNIVVK